ncbi:hypothetical protein VHEMI07933 [[Torrubiella] hemipterigena]|uniref:Uncharacterized protein n=1 Tax=[Torrubiella] hemipterigena TaxID=1531966 RepID=A0A0A1TNU3_9HYPO|nr:hypothetical protein VHEMI07933 [[Torrubiella] hemipterigena]
MSKRVLKQLVEKKYVRGWDDPRLYTLIALRRREIPPQAILAVFNELGVTTARVFIQAKRFEQTVRSYLEHIVPRLMMVLDPVAVVIEDLSETLALTLPFSPKDASFDFHTVPMVKTIYIAPVGFPNRRQYRILSAGTWEDYAAGRVTEIRAVFDNTTKPKAYIQWVSEGAKPVEARVNTSLFLSDDLMAVEGGYANDINPKSETIYSDALIEPGIDKVRERAPWPNGTAEKKVYGDGEVPGSPSRILSRRE